MKDAEKNVKFYATLRTILHMAHGNVALIVKGDGVGVRKGKDEWHSWPSLPSNMLDMLEHTAIVEGEQILDLVPEIRAEEDVLVLTVKVPTPDERD